MEKEVQRIAKFMASSGFCSRRDAEKIILENRVKVNGKIVNTPAFNVSAEDEVKVDGIILNQPEFTRLWLFNKPKGYITSNKDEKGRAVIFDILPQNMPRVVSVGRLDYNTEGLLLLTTNGTLAGKIESPKLGWIRRYKVRVHGDITDGKISKMAAGITYKGIKYAPIKAEVEQEKGSNTWLMVYLTEGKNREIRNIFESLNLIVTRLIRVSYGPFQLGALKEGEIREVPQKILKEQLGNLL